MAIVKLTPPTASAPKSVQDYVRILERADKLVINQTYIDIDGVSLTGTDTAPTKILKDSIYFIGGSIYYADADTTIAGSLVDGVNAIAMIPNGTNLDPTFTTDLVGVDRIYNQLLDGSDNFCLSWYIVKASTVYNIYKFLNPLDIYGRKIDGSWSFIKTTGYVASSITNVNLYTVDAPNGLKSGTDVTIKWKKYTGTTDGNGDAIFAHGLTSSKILNGYCLVNTTGYVWRRIGSAEGDIEFGATNATFNGNASLFNKSYRAFIMYEA